MKKSKAITGYVKLSCQLKYCHCSCKSTAMKTCKNNNSSSTYSSKCNM